MNASLPFVGRAKEANQLRRWHARRKHVLILGPAGIGKTALVTCLKEKLDLLICPQSEHLGAICESLEPQVGLDAGGLRLLQRKQRLRQALAEAGRIVVFDRVGWTTPKLSSFLEAVMQRVPIWICARSEHSWDIGHFWLQLGRFERLELRPFDLAATREFVKAAVRTGLVAGEALGVVRWLHYRSNGNPLVLRDLLEELAAREYDLSNPHALRRLELDRRIHEMFPLEVTFENHIPSRHD
jgi:predicted ATPase